jgi:DNA-binding LytR/AlgR family response regulator
MRNLSSGAEKAGDKMMRITICDDDIRICEVFRSAVQRLYPKASVSIYTDAGKLLQEERLPDILLLDIKMPGISGMEAAKDLRESGWRGILIFITGNEEYVFEAFDVKAFHFLVKPIHSEKLEEVLENAVRELSVQDQEEETEDVITISAAGEHIRVKTAEILYAEVYGRKVIVVTKDRKIEYYGTLSSLKALLGKGFYQPHRAYLINFRYVESYDSKEIVLKGSRLPMARRHYQEFVEKYMEYCEV